VRRGHGVTLGPYLTETQFAQTVVDLAKYLGWRVVHFRPARTDKGWRTAMTGDRGFPDLVLARRGVVLHVELKTQHGRLGSGQAEWAESIGESYRLWRPADLDQIREELR
jgi:hypothetical protein